MAAHDLDKGVAISCDAITCTSISKQQKALTKGGKKERKENIIIGLCNAQLSTTGWHIDENVTL